MNTFTVWHEIKDHPLSAMIIISGVTRDQANHAVETLNDLHGSVDEFYMEMD